MSQRISADQKALAAIGESIRARLASDPAAYRLPTDQAEIYAFGDFLSPDECAYLMAMIDDLAQPSSTYDTGHGPSFRTSYSADVDPHNPFVRMIERRISDLLGIDPLFGETVQGQRYTPGQEFKAHHDWFYTDSAYWTEEKERGGQRCWTAMCYLNAVEEGGATEFPHLGIAVAPQPGALLIWNNAHPDGTPNENTLHAAQPVKQGVKYVITKWYRTRPWG